MTHIIEIFFPDGRGDILFRKVSPFDLRIFVFVETTYSYDPIRWNRCLHHYLLAFVEYGWDNQMRQFQKCGKIPVEAVV